MEYDFGDFLFVGMIGPHFRPTQGPSPSALQVGNELRLSTGLFLPLRDGRLMFSTMETQGLREVVRRGEQVPYLPSAGLGDFDLVLSYAGGGALTALTAPRAGVQAPWACESYSSPSIWPSCTRLIASR